MSDRIEKQIDIAAPVSRVWRAITDYREFGEWFRVKLEGPFEAGHEARGKMLHPGYEHVSWRAVVKEMRPETLFSFTWHPYGIDESVDYTKEEPTLVEFRLAPTATGTRLTLTESGFDKVPANRRDEAFRMNEKGWAQQVKNIAQHVEAGSTTASNASTVSNAS
jgi:uncharacterized protein YndB with AHSA1/START domain